MQDSGENTPESKISVLAGVVIKINTDSMTTIFAYLLCQRFCQQNNLPQITPLMKHFKQTRSEKVLQNTEFTKLRCFEYGLTLGLERDGRDYVREEMKADSVF